MVYLGNFYNKELKDHKVCRDKIQVLASIKNGQRMIVQCKISQEIYYIVRERPDFDTERIFNKWHRLKLHKNQEVELKAPTLLQNINSKVSKLMQYLKIEQVLNDVNAMICEAFRWNHYNKNLKQKVQYQSTQDSQQHSESQAGPYFLDLTSSDIQAKWKLDKLPQYFPKEYSKN